MSQNPNQGSDQDEDFSALCSAQLRILIAWKIPQELSFDQLGALVNACQQRGADVGLVDYLSSMLAGRPENFLSSVDETENRANSVCQALIAAKCGQDEKQFEALSQGLRAIGTTTQLDEIYRFLLAQQSELLIKQRVLGIGFDRADEQAFSRMANLILGAMIE